MTPAGQTHTPIVELQKPSGHERTTPWHTLLRHVGSVIHLLGDSHLSPLSGNTTGQGAEFPVQKAFGLQESTPLLHWNSFGWNLLGGQLADSPSHSSTRSHGPPLPRHTVFAGLKELIGHSMLLPSQVSGISHAESAAGLQTKPAGWGRSVGHWALFPVGNLGCALPSPPFSLHTEKENFF